MIPDIYPHSLRHMLRKHGHLNRDTQTHIPLYFLLDTVDHLVVLQLQGSLDPVILVQLLRMEICFENHKMEQNHPGHWGELVVSMNQSII